MYIPRANRFDDHDAVLAFMRGNSFALLISTVDGRMSATHLPVVINDDGTTVTIHGHIARANPQWQSFSSGEHLIVFSGPHAYISPQHYEAEESVPTWNYIAVHAYGPLRVIDAETAPAELDREVRALIRTLEPGYEAQYDSLSQRYRDGMLRGTVGFVMSVTQLDAKAKLSQNRPHGDQERVTAALLHSPDGAERATGAAMAALRDTAEPQ